MPPDGTVSVGERFDTIESKLDTLTATVQENITNSKADYVRFQQIDQRLDLLESWQTWAMRIVIGAVIGAVLTLVIIQ